MESSDAVSARARRIFPCSVWVGSSSARCKFALGEKNFPTRFFEHGGLCSTWIFAGWGWVSGSVWLAGLASKKALPGSVERGLILIPSTGMIPPSRIKMVVR